MSQGKKTVVADSANVSAVVAEIEKQRRSTHAPVATGPNMVPVMSPRRRKPLPAHLREPDPVVNPDTPYNELPEQHEVTNPDTGRPYRNIRFKSVRGNVIQKQ